MAGVKGKSGRKPIPGAKHDVVIIRVNEKEKAALKEMAQRSNAGTISALVIDLVKEKAAEGGAADAWKG